MACGPGLVDPGLVDLSLWTWACGPGLVDLGLWTLACGTRLVDLETAAIRWWDKHADRFAESTPTQWLVSVPAMAKLCDIMGNDEGALFPSHRKNV
jgi:hypothetical protein